MMESTHVKMNFEYCKIVMYLKYCTTNTDIGVFYVVSADFECITYSENIKISPSGTFKEKSLSLGHKEHLEKTYIGTFHELHSIGLETLLVELPIFI